MQDSLGSLTIDQIASLLRATTQTLRAELEPLAGEVLGWHSAEGEWCVNEVLGHMVEAERRGFAGRIQRIREQPGRRLVTWDQVGVARERRDCERHGLELLGELEGMREEGIRLVAGLDPGQFSLAGDHPNVGELRVGDVLHEWVHHDRNHVKQILSNVQAYVWPNMGNARRFSVLEG